MAGIYIHIPFCRQACHYCNFHFSTSTNNFDRLHQALLTEIDLRCQFLAGATIDTIYFGGGTPSLFAIEKLNDIIEKLKGRFAFSDQLEITLEANPEDIHLQYLIGLKSIGVNRLSVGIQSFDQSDLELMNRAHDANQSISAIEMIKEVGFDSFTCDFMFGLIGSNLSDWERNLQKAINFDIPHLSCYNLTIEEQTAFAKWEKTGRISQPKDEVQQKQFMLTHQLLQELGYDHYEISNYCKEGHHAIHNTNYWKGAPYLGIGPSAHSFNGQVRQWNVANNVKYIESASHGDMFWEEEHLTQVDRYNEMIMLGLRTKWGVQTMAIENLNLKLQLHFNELAKSLIDQGMLSKTADAYTVPVDKLFLSDSISAELFYDN